jgi:hypothetical protein
MRARSYLPPGTQSPPPQPLAAWRPRRLPVTSGTPGGLSRTVIEVGFGPEEAKLDVIIEGLNAAEQQAAIKAFPGGQRFNVLTRKAS